MHILLFSLCKLINYIYIKQIDIIYIYIEKIEQCGAWGCFC